MADDLRAYLDAELIDELMRRRIVFCFAAVGEAGACDISFNGTPSLLREMISALRAQVDGESFATPVVVDAAPGSAADPFVLPPTFTTPAQNRKSEANAGQSTSSPVPPCEEEGE